MPPTLPDPKAFETALRAIEADATRLPWAKERAWRTATHTRMEGPWIVVDLHDLSVPLARRVLQAVEAADVGALRLITGRGRHTGGRSKLRDAVIADARERGWHVTEIGPGRVEIVRDPDRHPIGGGVPIAVWAVLALVALGLVLWLLR